MTLRLGIVLTVTLSASTAYTLAGDGAVTLNGWIHRDALVRRIPAADRVTPPRSAWSVPPTPLHYELTVRPVKDLHGNDVSDAVARYKADPEGTLYEEHSPETEIPHLRPPTT